MFLMLIYDCTFYICSFICFLFVCLDVFVNNMLFIIQALHYSKHQVHFLSFIDMTMNKRFDYVYGFSQVSQCSRNIFHGFSGTSVHQIKYTVVSAYSGAFFLNSNGVVSPTRTMFVHKVHVSP